jgi:hypothetical protein
LRVDGEEAHLLLDEPLLHLAREVIPHLGLGPGRVEQEDRALARALEHVVAVEELRLVAGDDARAPHLVRRADRAGPEAKVRDRDGAGLLGVVDEVSLRREPRALADDLDRALVAAHRAVGAEAVHDGAHDRVGLDVERGVDAERAARDVVLDAHREVIGRLRERERVEDRPRRAGRVLLGREPVTAADDAHRAPRLRERGDDVEVERLADRAGLLRAIEDRDALGRARQGRDERRDVERPVEAHAQEADALAARHEVVDGLVRRLRARAQDHDHARRLGVAVVLEQPIRAARHLGEAVHDGLHGAGARVVERVRGLSRLKERVRVLGRAAERGAVRRERARAVREDQLLRDQRAQVVVGERRDLRDLVRGAEAVEEVEKRDARPERRRVGDRGEVLRLLHRARAEHGEAGAAAGHHVRVVAEDRERVRRDRARRDVQAERRQLAGDLEQVRDHEQEALRRGERRHERARLERAVGRAGGARLGLHLDDARDLAEHVLAAVRGPLVAVLSHRGGRRDGVDGDDLAEAVRDRGDGLVGVEGHRAGSGHGRRKASLGPSAGAALPRWRGRPGRADFARGATPSRGRALGLDLVLVTEAALERDHVLGRRVEDRARPAVAPAELHDDADRPLRPRDRVAARVLVDVLDLDVVDEHGEPLGDAAVEHAQLEGLGTIRKLGHQALPSLSP